MPAQRRPAPAIRRKPRERQGAHCILGQKTPENAVELGVIAINPYVPDCPDRCPRTVIRRGQGQLNAYLSSIEALLLPTRLSTSPLRPSTHPASKWPERLPPISWHPSTRAGDVLDHLDDIQFLVPKSSQHDIEFGLFRGRGAAPAPPAIGPAIMIAPPAAGSIPYFSFRQSLSSLACFRVNPAILSANSTISAEKLSVAASDIAVQALSHNAHLTGSTFGAKLLQKSFRGWLSVGVVPDNIKVLSTTQGPAAAH